MVHQKRLQFSEGGGSSDTLFVGGFNYLSNYNKLFEVASVNVVKIKFNFRKNFNYKIIHLFDYRVSIQ